MTLDHDGDNILGGPFNRWLVSVGDYVWVKSADRMYVVTELVPIEGDERHVNVRARPRRAGELWQGGDEGL